MTDYNSQHDPRRAENENAAFTPVTTPSRNFYLVIGVVVAIVLAGGLLFMNTPPTDRTDVARQPDRTLETPTNDTRTPSIPPRPMAPTTTPTAPQPQE